METWEYLMQMKNKIVFPKDSNARFVEGKSMKNKREDSKVDIWGQIVVLGNQYKKNRMMNSQF